MHGCTAARLRTQHRSVIDLDDLNSSNCNPLARAQAVTFPPLVGKEPVSVDVVLLFQRTDNQVLSWECQWTFIYSQETGKLQMVVGRTARAQMLREDTYPD